MGREKKRGGTSGERGNEGQKKRKRGRVSKNIG